MENINILKDGLSQLKIEYNDDIIDKFDRFTSILIDYNKKVNLTAIKEEKDIIIKHYLDAASLLSQKHIFGKSVSVIDIGCGAGFPSFPIRFLRDDLKITMLDSTKKKTDFQIFAANELSLKNLNFLCGRAEELSTKPEYRQKFDVALARGVSRLSMLCEYCLPFALVGGYFIAMKNDECEEELEDAQNAIKILGGEVEKVIKIPLPFSDITHSLVIIKKISDTLIKYPRIGAKISKSPL